jgi:hypothetical protein
MRRLVLIAVLALAAAPQAFAKGGVEAIKICGAEGCVTTSLEKGIYELPGEGAARVLTPPIEPFVEVRLTMHGMVDWLTLWYLPESRLLATGHATWTEWRLLAPHTLDRAIVAAAEQVEPFSPPRIHAARVDGRRVAQPSAIDAVFAAVTPGKAAADDPRSVPVSVIWSAANPWEDVEVRWIPGTRLWQRGENVYFVEPDLLSADGRRGVPWPTVAAALALLAGLGLVLRLRRRLALTLAGAAVALVVAAPAAAKFPITLTLGDATPRVGQQIRVAVSIPARYAEDANMRLVAVPPGMGMYAAIKAEERHGVQLVRRGGTWRGTFRFPRAGRWLLVVPNWGAPGYALPPPVVRKVRVGA